jgi:hypothetical protein
VDNKLAIGSAQVEEEEEDEINFDQLLGDAAQSQADYEEDRDDSDDEDVPDLGDSLAFTKTKTYTGESLVKNNEGKADTGEQPQNHIATSEAEV